MSRSWSMRWKASRASTWGSARSSTSVRPSTKVRIRWGAPNSTMPASISRSTSNEPFDAGLVQSRSCCSGRSQGQRTRPSAAAACRSEQDAEWARLNQDAGILRAWSAAREADVSAIPTIPAATKVYSAVRDQNVKPPNINELSEYVNRVLALRGLRANQDKIKDLANKD